jgi:outer membrane biosynthesis protein TonB
MNKSQAIYSRRLSSLLLLSASLMLFLLPLFSAQSPTQDPQTGSTPSAPTPQTDTEKKATERKKRFEERKKALESKDQPAPQPKTQNAPTKSGFDAKACLAAHRENRFHDSRNDGDRRDRAFLPF